MPSPDRGYGVTEVARLVGASRDWVRRFARDGHLEATRDERGHYRLTFRDLLMLRTARRLCDEVTPRRLRRAIRLLDAQLPKPLSEADVRMTAEGGRLAVSDGARRWLPETGQLLMPLEPPGADEATVHAIGPADIRESWRRAHQHYRRGVVLDDGDDDQAAFDAYLECLQLMPDHHAARINIGRLYHRAGQYEEAEEQYRLALTVSPRNVTAAYNLGVVLEDQAKYEQALDAYDLAVTVDPDYADAHFNAASVCEILGLEREAIEHRARHRRLTFRTV